MNRYERWLLFIQAVSAVAVVVTLVYLAVQTEAMRDQTEEMTDQTRAMTEQTALTAAALDNSAYQALANQEFELDKMFVENSKWRPFFYTNRHLNEKQWEDPKVKVYPIAEFKLDYLDTYLLHTRSMNQADLSNGTSKTMFDETILNEDIEF